MKQRHRILLICLIVVSAWLSGTSASAGQWQLPENPLFTPWADDVDPENAWGEYPRPQMVREEWLSLNGLWDYAITAKNTRRPKDADGKILVPFCIESALSGVKRNVGADKRLWYRRTFDVPKSWQDRLLLHFGAVDFECTVWVNRKKLGTHRGGYTPFSFDITDCLKSGSQELMVSVWDPTDKWTQARGKQVSEPGGIWYTSVTGIWQSVWIEPVPQYAIAGIEAQPDVDTSTLLLTVSPDRPRPGLTVKAVALETGKVVGQATGFAGQLLHLPMDNPRLWSPDSPFLYDLKVTLLDNGEAVDEVSSYFGMRKIAMAKDEHGYNRLALNNKQVFQLGPLDQGWWPDGLYTAPTDEAMQYDLKVTKQLGFNMLRKHVKVEPARFYYHCDRMGLLVWQDMPNGNLRKTEPDNLRIGLFDPDAKRPADSAEQFEAELTELIGNFRHFPCIVMWVPFNEGWGQYDTARIAGMVRQLDPTRLVNSASGWTDRGVGDVEDVHEYPGPAVEPAQAHRAAVLGEFGGLGWPVEGHLWWNKRNWGYRTYSSREELNRNYKRIVGNVLGCIGYGVAAAIYTQTTDVEGEVNGLMTYDRKVIKYDSDVLCELHRRLYESRDVAQTIVATGEQASETWRYRLGEANRDWANPDFDDGQWRQGSGAFQSGDDRAFPMGTKWTGKRIYLRKACDLDKVPSNLWLQFYQNTSEAQLYINGELVKSWQKAGPNRRHYRHENISEHVGALRPGCNVIALCAEKDKGIRGIDIGLYTLVNPQ